MFAKLAGLGAMRRILFVFILSTVGLGSCAYDIEEQDRPRISIFQSSAFGPDGNLFPLESAVLEVGDTFSFEVFANDDQLLEALRITTTFTEDTIFSTSGPEGFWNLDTLVPVRTALFEGVITIIIPEDIRPGFYRLRISALDDQSSESVAYSIYVENFFYPVMLFQGAFANIRAPIQIEDNDTLTLTYQPLSLDSMEQTSFSFLDGENQLFKDTTLRNVNQFEPNVLQVLLPVDTNEQVNRYTLTTSLITLSGRVRSYLIPFQAPSKE